jgi:hypothetical protein
MSNYPNMSYCMCGNTLAALNQIVNAIQNAGSVADFEDNLSTEEARWFREILRLTGDLLEDATFGNSNSYVSD